MSKRKLIPAAAACLSGTEQPVAQVEGVIRQVVAPGDLGMIVSNIGPVPDFSAIYTPDAAQHTAFVQISLKNDHPIGSYGYMRRVQQRLAGRRQRGVCPAGPAPLLED